MLRAAVDSALLWSHLPGGQRPRPHTIYVPQLVPSLLVFDDDEPPHLPGPTRGSFDPRLQKPVDKLVGHGVRLDVADSPLGVHGLEKPNLIRHGWLLPPTETPPHDITACRPVRTVMGGKPIPGRVAGYGMLCL